MSIRFSCATCGKQFSVADNWAGRRAKCKDCGSVISVPIPLGNTPPPPPPIQTPLDYSTRGLERPKTLFLVIGGAVAAAFVLGILALLPFPRRLPP